MAELTQIKSVDSRKLSNKRSRSDYVFDNQSFTDDKSNGIEHTVNVRVAIKKLQHLLFYGHNVYM